MVRAVCVAAADRADSRVELLHHERGVVTAQEGGRRGDYVGLPRDTRAVSDGRRRSLLADHREPGGAANESDRQTRHERWHLDKEVPLALSFGLLLQTSLAI